MKLNHKERSTTPLSQRRLKTKPVLLLIGILLLGNLLWFIGWLIPSNGQDLKEEVASVNGQEITRQDWMIAMESRYGKEILRELVNGKVMEQAAKKYKISVSDEEINLEIALIRSTQDRIDTAVQKLDEKQLRQRIRAQLIFEKVLTKDVVIEDEAIKKFYEENKSLYNIPTAYRTSLIALQSKEDAEKTLKELESGSAFDVLARERSVDVASASLGGDIGYITEQQENVDSVVLDSIKTLKVGQWSKVLSLKDGRYGIVLVQEVVKGQSFNFEDVKDRIRRSLAIEQLPQSVTPEAFWKEFNTTWFYGES